MIPIGDGNGYIHKEITSDGEIETDMIPIGDGNHHRRTYTA